MGIGVIITVTWLKKKKDMLALHHMGHSSLGHEVKRSTCLGEQMTPVLMPPPEYQIPCYPVTARGMWQFVRRGVVIRVMRRVRGVRRVREVRGV